MTASTIAGDVVGFGDHDAAEAGVLHEAVDALVAPHHDMGDDVDPQPRRFALADAAIEQVDLIGNLREQRIERLVEDFEPRHFGVAQVDDDAGAIGGLDPRLPQRVAQPHRARSLTAWLPVFCASDIRWSAFVLMGPDRALTYQ